MEDRTGVEIGLDLEVDLNDLPERYFVNVWHIFQESFSNIEKYTKAKNVSVKIENTDDGLRGSSGADVRVTIADNGAGFDLETAELGRGYGPPNIKDRAEHLAEM